MLVLRMSVHCCRAVRVVLMWNAVCMWGIGVFMHIELNLEAQVS